MTIEQYLADPAYKHAEYVAGEVVALKLGTGQHGRIQVGFSFRFKEYLKRNPIGHAYGQLHCRLNIGGQIRFRLPDVSVILGQLVDGYSERAPDLCVEIRSPEDSVSEQISKFHDYFLNGCKLGWLVLPEERSVLILTPSAPPRAVHEGAELDGADVLPGLRIPVAELFG